MNILKKVSIMLFTAVLVLPAIALAQTTPRGGSGLSISPTRFELLIERGKAELVSVQVKNVTDDDVIARVYLNDFEPEGNTGNPKLIIDSSEQSSSSIRDFVLGLEDIEIKAGATVVVDLPIQIPENASPGAYYGAVRFTGVPIGQEDSAEDVQLALNASVAALVLIEVPGDITEKIEVVDVSAYLDKDSGSLFTIKPNNIGIEIKNLGNGFSKPFGRVAVSGPWGAGEILSYELNDTSPRGNVLPNSSRLFTDELSGVSMPGRYKIEANISHGNGGEILTVTSTFWYLPMWFLITVFVVLLVLVWLGYYLYRKYVTKSVKRSKR